jgi:ABC-type polysaccharide/polyol phosphate transport system, ATPase component
MSDAALEVHHVSKKFRRGEIYDSLRDLIPALTGRMFRTRANGELDKRDFWALRDVTFDVKQGEAFGIIGDNGAGKSTILKLLTGIMRPTEGRITVRGRLSALIEVSAGFHPDLTGRENIFLNGAILGLTRQEITQRFDDIVAFSGLEAFIDTPVKRYSSGMFARLGFSVAAHVDPEVLLVDEVLSVGDYAFQRKCLERMDQVIRNGTTVVFISHNLRAVGNLCHRSLLVRGGTVTMIGRTSDVLKEYLQGEARRSSTGDRGIEITRVELANALGPSVEFNSGDKILVSVEAVARRRYEDVSVVIQITDDQAYPLFDSCTDRLGRAPFELEAGQEVRATFEIEATLAEGTFHVNGYLFAYTTNEAYDKWANAATFFIGGTPAVRGSVNLQPRLVACEIREGGSGAPTLTGAARKNGVGDADEDGIAPQTI